MDVYKKIENPAAFGGIDALRKASGATRKQVKRYLGSNSTYRKFFRNKTKFERARILVSSIGHIFQADLFDMQNLAKYNKNFRYILLVVDTFSRLIKAKPLLSKSAVDVAAALHDVFQEFKDEDLLALKSMLATDLGNEFWNSEAKKVFEKFGVHHYPLRPPLKCSIAEISGRHLKDRIYKYMDSAKTKNWVSNLSKFVNAKNKRPNRSLGHTAPIDVSYENQDRIYKTLYSKTKKVTKPLEIGTRVQIALDLLPFHKSFHGYFGENIYEIIRRIRYKNIHRFILKDIRDNAEIAGSYYREEILPF